MTKEIAVFDSSALPHLIDCLRAAGYQLRNPATSKITGFDTTGECRELAMEEDAMLFLVAGNGLSLWANESEDVFVSLGSGNLEVSFDGFEQHESERLMQVFRDASLSFDVAYDD